MSWLIGKAENLLNKVDQAAGTALKEAGAPVSQEGLPQVGATNAYVAPPVQNPVSSVTNLPSSASVPANLNVNKTNNQTYLSQLSRNTQNSPMQSSISSTNGKPQKRDKDEELFEFLNSPDNGSDGSMKRKTSHTNLKSIGSGKHSRQSSVSSTVSNKSNKTGEVKSTSVVITTDSSTENNDTESVGHVSQYDTIDDILGNQDTSSGYHSTQDDGNQSQLSSLELENRLLKNEVQSLNEEMNSVIKRAKDSQDELVKLRRKTDTQNQQLQKSDQIVRELQSQVCDLQEALSAKDAQIGVLRVRFEEADKQNQSSSRVLSDLKTQNERILQDHTSASGVHSQTLDTLKDKLSEAEDRLRHEHLNAQKSQGEFMGRQSKLETELQHVSEQLATAQRRLNDEKARSTDLVSQCKSAKHGVDLAKQELSEYKEKATRILQSKDKLIASLKEGGSVGASDTSFSSAELESAKQEISMLKEEVQHNRLTMENVRAEQQDLEMQTQQDAEQSAEQMESLQDQLGTEKQHREDSELQNNKQQEELRYAHEELLKQKTAFQSRLQDRETEIERLRNQLTTKSLGSTSQVELENRLHSLTESLIQKQTTLEALSTEKNSLVLQLERLERQYKEVELTSMRNVTTTVHINDDDEARQRLPLFMREAPGDGEMARRVKRAYSTVDTFSIRMGVFLRRYPVARVFVFGYMALLHVWVMIVLLTYKPEMHGLDFNPHEPQ